MDGRKPKLQNVVPFKGDMAAKVVPDAPEQLSERARAVWKELAAHLVARDRLQPHYLHLFGAYCESVASFYDSIATIELEGYYFETQTRNGRQQKKVAMWGIQQDAMSAMMRLSALFGLSPVDEARLKTGSQGDLFADMLAQLKNGPD